MLSLFLKKANYFSKINHVQFSYDKILVNINLKHYKERKKFLTNFYRLKLIDLREKVTQSWEKLSTVYNA